MKTKNIHQTIILKASSKEVYHALMNSRLHSKITGSKAVIATKVGGTFSIWEGGVNGINLALEPDKRIVQAWRTEEWPKGHYSVADFSLAKKRRGTELVLDHYGIPVEDYKNIAANWETCYWIPLRKMFEDR